MVVDYYRILQVDRDASDHEIKRSYRRLAIEFHPDRNPDDFEALEQFKRICEAYDVLSDPGKRRLYDRLGRNPKLAEAVGGMPEISSFGAVVADTLGAVYENLFGTDDGDTFHRGRDQRYVLEIDLAEAAFGCQKVVEVPRKKRCDRCAGTGGEPGTGFATCKICNGDGRILTQRGPLKLSRPCPRCEARGEIPRKPCTRCDGRGEIRGRARLIVKVPAGVDDETHLKLRGEGEPGRGGAPAGDLLVDIAIAPHPVFERVGADLTCRVPVSLTRAALGGNIDAPTLAGSTVLKLPPGTDSHTVFRVAGEGMPVVGSARGDLLVTIVIETPKHLTAEQTRLLQRLDELTTAETLPAQATFTRRVADWVDKRLRGSNDAGPTP